MTTQGNRRGPAIEGVRSLLFIPVLEPRFFAKAGERGADGLILDLEDSIAGERKAEARQALAGAVAALRATGLPVLCRVNNLPALLEEDLAACAAAGVDAVMLPKVESAGEVRQAAEGLAFHEARCGSQASTQIVALMETPKGVLHAEEIAAAHDRLIALGFGAEDFTSSMGITAGKALLLHAAAHVAIAAAAAGKACWGLAASIAVLDDLDSLREAALEARALGFSGSPAVHPAQVRIFNEVFRPSATEIAQAQRVVAAYAEASRSGTGACRLDGRMIDKPIVERAARILASAN
jgi:citrate lyase subunit beta / citryl-CoA lyase